ncbi:MAG: 2-amino-4-hydroxy-6-hydroxymethyldihydropteridine diphosphokinase [Planctomycetes bacterium]|nr:2-amino-4-hydroxy-6-hydroxymethyldihydropteridine diphosphokinase [Planctomycetota bacterium]
MDASAFVGLGSNLGARERLLTSAVEGLAVLPRTRLVRVSSWIETAPEGGPAGQGPYLNGAAELATELAPRELLDALLALERRAGRVRVAGVANGPRTLDLDLLLHGSARLAEPGLVVPHPRLEERLFVLRPLAELAPELVLPSGAPIRARIAELERTELRREPARTRAFEISTLRRTRP